MDTIMDKFYEDTKKTDECFLDDQEIKSLNGIELTEEDEKRADRSYYICDIEPIDFASIRSLREYANKRGIDENRFIIYGRIIPFKKKVSITYEIG